ncbi:MAG: hypothetical protein GQF41_0936 [Candidatus Rifleibacterium amylolyticum]|nr:MAG: hypothetical protein GQF41_0936 [Candidatus Rifleibacterium amylolyticum]NLF97123.1 hypothetical protein [Candidatus Riflebacteria bacterium]
MLINEIEITGSSISLKCWGTKFEDVTATFNQVMQRGDQFDLDSEIPGFHDCDCENSVMRGFYSVVVPFEIEHLVEGITTKTLFKRIESCEFIISENCMYSFGKPGPQKLLGAALAAATGVHVDLIEFEFSHLSMLQERMTRIKTIVVTNPKEKEIRRARLAGHMESYTEYNIVDPRNHGIESVAGLIDTPLGPLTINVGKKGSIRLNVKKGLIMTLECLDWIMSLIMDEKRPDPIKAPQSAF